MSCNDVNRNGEIRDDVTKTSSRRPIRRCQQQNYQDNRRECRKKRQPMMTVSSKLRNCDLIKQGAFTTCSSEEEEGQRSSKRLRKSSLSSLLIESKVSCSVVNACSRSDSSFILLEKSHECSHSHNDSRKNELGHYHDVTSHTGNESSFDDSNSRSSSSANCMLSSKGGNKEEIILDGSSCASSAICSAVVGSVDKSEDLKQNGRFIKINCNQQKKIIVQDGKNLSSEKGNKKNGSFKHPARRRTQKRAHFQIKKDSLTSKAQSFSDKIATNVERKITLQNEQFYSVPSVQSVQSRESVPSKSPDNVLLKGSDCQKPINSSLSITLNDDSLSYLNASKHPEPYNQLALLSGLCPPGSISPSIVDNIINNNHISKSGNAGSLYMPVSSIFTSLCTSAANVISSTSFSSGSTATVPGRCDLQHSLGYHHLSSLIANNLNSVFPDSSLDFMALCGLDPTDISRRLLHTPSEKIDKCSVSETLVDSPNVSLNSHSIISTDTRSNSACGMSLPSAVTSSSSDTIKFPICENNDVAEHFGDNSISNLSSFAQTSNKLKFLSSSKASTKLGAKINENKQFTTRSRSGSSKTLSKDEVWKENLSSRTCGLLSSKYGLPYKIKDSISTCSTETAKNPLDSTRNNFLSITNGTVSVPSIASAASTEVTPSLSTPVCTAKVADIYSAQGCDPLNISVDVPAVSVRPSPVLNSGSCSDHSVSVLATTAFVTCADCSCSNSVPSYSADSPVKPNLTCVSNSLSSNIAKAHDSQVAVISSKNFPADHSKENFSVRGTISNVSSCLMSCEKKEKCSVIHNIADCICSLNSSVSLTTSVSNSDISVHTSPLVVTSESHLDLSGKTRVQTNPSLSLESFGAESEITRPARRTPHDQEAAVIRTRRVDAAEPRTTLPMSLVNDCFVCRLCHGYLVDPTANGMCPHIFCRSCIVRYIENSSYCPVCDVLLHGSVPDIKLMPDVQLQRMLYMLLPRLYADEARRREEFYQHSYRTLEPVRNNSDSPSVAAVCLERNRLSGLSSVSSDESLTSSTSCNATVSRTNNYEITGNDTDRLPEKYVTALDELKTLVTSLETSRDRISNPREATDAGFVSPQNCTSDGSVPVTGASDVGLVRTVNEHIVSSETNSLMHYFPVPPSLPSPPLGHKDQICVQLIPCSPAAATMTSRYIQCEASTRIFILVAFLRKKYNISEKYTIYLLIPDILRIRRSRLTKNTNSVKCSTSQNSSSLNNNTNAFRHTYNGLEFNTLLGDKTTNCLEANTARNCSQSTKPSVGNIEPYPDTFTSQNNPNLEPASFLSKSAEITSIRLVDPLMCSGSNTGNADSALNCSTATAHRSQLPCDESYPGLLINDKETVRDVAYISQWSMRKPLQIFYRIFMTQIPSRRSSSFSSCDCCSSPFSIPRYLANVSVVESTCDIGGVNESTPEAGTSLSVTKNGDVAIACCDTRSSSASQDSRAVEGPFALSSVACENSSDANVEDVEMPHLEPSNLPLPLNCDIVHEFAPVLFAEGLPETKNNVNIDDRPGKSICPLPVDVALDSPSAVLAQISDATESFKAVSKKFCPDASNSASSKSTKTRKRVNKLRVDVKGKSKKLDSAAVSDAKSEDKCCSDLSSNTMADVEKSLQPALKTSNSEPTSNILVSAMAQQQLLLLQNPQHLAQVQQVSQVQHMFIQQQQQLTHASVSVPTFGTPVLDIATLPNHSQSSLKPLAPKAHTSFPDNLNSVSKVDSVSNTLPVSGDSAVNTNMGFNTGLISPPLFSTVGLGYNIMPLVSAIQPDAILAIDANGTNYGLQMLADSDASKSILPSDGVVPALTGGAGFRNLAEFSNISSSPILSSIAGFPYATGSVLCLGQNSNLNIQQQLFQSILGTNSLISPTTPTLQSAYSALFSATNLIQQSALGTTVFGVDAAATNFSKGTNIATPNLALDDSNSQCSDHNLVSCSVPSTSVLSTFDVHQNCPQKNGNLILSSDLSKETPWKEVQLKISENGVMSVSSGPDDFTEKLLNQVESDSSGSSLLTSVEHVSNSDVSNTSVSLNHNFKPIVKYPSVKDASNECKAKLAEKNTNMIAVADKESLSPISSSPVAPALVNSAVKSCENASSVVSNSVNLSSAQDTPDVNCSLPDKISLFSSSQTDSSRKSVSTAESSTSEDDKHHSDVATDDKKLNLSHSDKIQTCEVLNNTSVPMETRKMGDIESGRESAENRAVSPKSSNKKEEIERQTCVNKENLISESHRSTEIASAPSSPIKLILKDTKVVDEHESTNNEEKGGERNLMEEKGTKLPLTEFKRKLSNDKEENCSTSKKIKISSDTTTKESSDITDRNILAKRPILDRKTSKLKQIAEKQREVSGKLPVPNLFCDNTEASLKSDTNKSNFSSGTKNLGNIAIQSLCPSNSSPKKVDSDSVPKMSSNRKSSVGYKTLKMSPKCWNPTISRDQLHLSANCTAKTNKFFKARNASNSLSSLTAVLSSTMGISSKSSTCISFKKQSITTTPQLEQLSVDCDKKTASVSSSKSGLIKRDTPIKKRVLLASIANETFASTASKIGNNSHIDKELSLVSISSSSTERNDMSIQNPSKGNKGCSFADAVETSLIKLNDSAKTHLSIDDSESTDALVTSKSNNIMMYENDSNLTQPVEVVSIEKSAECQTLMSKNEPNSCLSVKTNCLTEKSLTDIKKNTTFYGHVVASNINSSANTYSNSHEANVKNASEPVTSDDLAFGRNLHSVESIVSTLSKNEKNTVLNMHTTSASKGKHEVSNDKKKKHIESIVSLMQSGASSVNPLAALSRSASSTTSLTIEQHECTRSLDLITSVAESSSAISCASVSVLSTISSLTASDAEAKTKPPLLKDTLASSSCSDNASSPTNILTSTSSVENFSSATTDSRVHCQLQTVPLVTDTTVPTKQSQPTSPSGNQVYKSNISVASTGASSVSVSNDSPMISTFSEVKSNQSSKTNSYQSPVHQHLLVPSVPLMSTQYTSNSTSRCSSLTQTVKSVVDSNQPVVTATVSTTSKNDCLADAGKTTPISETSNNIVIDSNTDASVNNKCIQKVVSLFDEKISNLSSITSGPKSQFGDKLSDAKSSSTISLKNSVPVETIDSNNGVSTTHAGCSLTSTAATSLTPVVVSNDSGSSTSNSTTSVSSTNFDYNLSPLNAASYYMSYPFLYQSPRLTSPSSLQPLQSSTGSSLESGHVSLASFFNTMASSVGTTTSECAEPQITFNSTLPAKNLSGNLITSANNLMVTDSEDSKKFDSCSLAESANIEVASEISGQQQSLATETPLTGLLDSSIVSAQSSVKTASKISADDNFKGSIPVNSDKCSNSNAQSVIPVHSSSLSSESVSNTAVSTTVSYSVASDISVTNSSVVNDALLTSKKSSDESIVNNKSSVNVPTSTNKSSFAVPNEPVFDIAKAIKSSFDFLISSPQTSPAKASPPHSSSPKRQAALPVPSTLHTTNKSSKASLAGVSPLALNSLSGANKSESADKFSETDTKLHHAKVTMTKNAVEKKSSDDRHTTDSKSSQCVQARPASTSANATSACGKSKTASQKTHLNNALQVKNKVFSPSNKVANASLTNNSQMLQNYQMINSNPYAFSNFSNALQQSSNLFDPLSAYGLSRNFQLGCTGNHSNSSNSNYASNFQGSSIGRPGSSMDMSGYGGSGYGMSAFAGASGFANPLTGSSTSSKTGNDSRYNYNCGYFNASPFNAAMAAAATGSSSSGSNQDHSSSSNSVNVDTAALNAYLSNINPSSYAMAANIPYFMSNSFSSVMQPSWNTFPFAKSGANTATMGSNASGVDNNSYHLSANGSNSYPGFYYNQNMGYGAGSLMSNSATSYSGYPYFPMHSFNTSFSTPSSMSFPRSQPSTSLRDTSFSNALCHSSSPSSLSNTKKNNQATSSKSHSKAGSLSHCPTNDKTSFNMMPNSYQWLSCDMSGRASGSSQGLGLHNLQSTSSYMIGSRSPSSSTSVLPKTASSIDGTSGFSWNSSFNHIVPELSGASGTNHGTISSALSSCSVASEDNECLHKTASYDGDSLQASKKANDK